MDQDKAGSFGEIQKKTTYESVKIKLSLKSSLTRISTDATTN